MTYWPEIKNLKIIFEKFKSCDVTFKSDLKKDLFKKKNVSNFSHIITFLLLMIVILQKVTRRITELNITEKKKEKWFLLRLLD